VTVELKPETERLVQEELRNGHFHSVDDLIVASVHAWREKHHGGAEGVGKKQRKRVYDLLTRAPFVGSELDVERQKDDPRPVDL
jgi:Arc/MetJ-type ribon-helix-helix transcriptional regulator